MLVAILANDVARVALLQSCHAVCKNNMEIIEMVFRVSGVMEEGEEHSEAQESDSGFGDPCKVEESFRLGHEVYIKSSRRPPPKKLSNARVSSMIGNMVLTGICEYAFECRFSCSCLICLHL